MKLHEYVLKSGTTMVQEDTETCIPVSDLCRTFQTLSSCFLLSPWIWSLCGLPHWSRLRSSSRCCAWDNQEVRNTTDTIRSFKMKIYFSVTDGTVKASSDRPHRWGGGSWGDTTLSKRPFWMCMRYTVTYYFESRGAAKKSYRRYYQWSIEHYVHNKKIKRIIS